MSETLYDRNSYLKFDSTLGNDPLSDKLLGKLQSVPYATTHLVQKRDEFRPDKLAAKLLGDSSLYWVILEYNQFSNFASLVSGIEIKVPNIMALNNLLLSSNSQVTTKTISIK